ncbi:uncharacterized protein B0I36DRAFT_376149 [Microdochium trichocladiopsis]|uniref:proline--tRNA ligase n=1 Tax=Microdochium trichocladiopsis TaxID=1682393 RepID=A0A9P8Y393_9PEZI|nr:uncharacterized protein B0I36DRAFT_376149 [Microdochium trichocladiopsis]KAH7026363.1 hypothetical protein B0I36DRAFT_376149 [Microdochium trichocladiopsis]
MPSIASVGGSLAGCRPQQHGITAARNLIRTRVFTQTYFSPPERYTRLSRFWIPTGGLHAKAKQEGYLIPRLVDAFDKLIRAGFLRQSQPGIFHLLPLAQRVQNKLEQLIDYHMALLGASKVSLSSLSSQALWQKTGRLEAYGPELLRLEDRKATKLLLAPTHEEEITLLVAGVVHSYKDLPLRLYQIGRKYRDELRPRQGLLRSREFTMKDLYTFDVSTEAALATYQQVRKAYSQLFDTLKLPYLVAEASSGDIGGDLSHEYHLPTSIGEDHVISCTECDYVANEEMAVPATMAPTAVVQSAEMMLFRGITKDRKQLVHVWFPASVEDKHTGQPRLLTALDINMHIIKTVVPLDSGIKLHAGMAAASKAASQPPLRAVHIVDPRVATAFSDSAMRKSLEHAAMPKMEAESCADGFHEIDVLRMHDGDSCPKCSMPSLRVQKAIELGHTFHLGTKYSKALSAQVQIPGEADRAVSQRTFVQMGCHGIGVSRIIGAVADHLSDDKGLNWPRHIAPFEVVVVPFPEYAEDAATVATRLSETRSTTDVALDVLLDDRPLSLPWKVKDADAVGYPVVVVLGRTWQENRTCSVQCRRLGSVRDVSLDELAVHVRQLLEQI